MQTNAILAGKFGSRRQSTTSLRENVLVANTSYRMLEIPFSVGRGLHLFQRK